MDAAQIQYPDGTFDYVLCGFALWFFPRPHRALQEFYRVLKPGGRLALTTWGHDSPMHNLQRDALRSHLIPTTNAGDTQKKPRFDTEEQLEAALLQSGFVDSKVFSEDFKAIIGEVDSLWEQLWSASFRKELESMSASIREMVKARFYRNLEALRQPDGIHAVYRALFALASK
jgi:SAM-dependent methyltransferase